MKELKEMFESNVINAGVAIVIVVNSFLVYQNSVVYQSDLNESYREITLIHKDTVAYQSDLNETYHDVNKSRELQYVPTRYRKNSF